MNPCETLPPKGKGNVSDRRLWPDGVVPYDADDDARNNQGQIYSHIIEAMADIESACPGVRFFELVGGGSHIFFVGSGGCASHIGMQGGRQEVYAGSSCRKPQVTHEVLHALGLVHEHCRRDRDDYVEVIWDNIEPGKSHNFQNSGTPSGGYDLRSVMHYTSTAWGINGAQTLRSLTSDRIDPSSTMTEYDIETVNLLYPLAPEPPETPIEPEPPPVTGPDPETKIVYHDRFVAALCWQTNDADGTGLADGMRANSGGFVFGYDLETVQVLCSVIDGRQQNGFWWVTIAAATDVAWSIRIEDGETGSVQTYDFEGGEPSPAIMDTEAFSA